MTNETNEPARPMVKTALLSLAFILPMLGWVFTQLKTGALNALNGKNNFDEDDN